MIWPVRKAELVLAQYLVSARLARVTRSLSHWVHDRNVAIPGHGVSCEQVAVSSHEVACLRVLYASGGDLSTRGVVPVSMGLRMTACLLA